MSRVVRERALPLIALLLALVGLVSNARGSDAARVHVIAAVRAVPAGAIVAPGAVRIVSIDARDRTPGHGHEHRRPRPGACSARRSPGATTCNVGRSPTPRTPPSWGLASGPCR